MIKYVVILRPESLLKIKVIGPLNSEELNRFLNISSREDVLVIPLTALEDYKNGS
jgi:hypothetical protein